MKQFLNKYKQLHQPGLLILGSIISLFFFFLFPVVVSHNVTFADLGLVTLFGSLLSLSDVAINALSRTITHKSAYLFGKNNAPVIKFWEYMHIQGILIGIAVSIIWLILSPFLANFFHTGTILPFILFTPVWSIGILLAISGGFLTGSQQFSRLALIPISESMGRFLLAVIIIFLGLNKFIYVAIPLAMLFSLFLANLFIKQLKSFSSKKVISNSITSFPWSFYFSSIVTKISSVAYLTLDVILAKHYLSPTDAGVYALLSFAGKMVYSMGSLFSQFLNPLVSKQIGMGKNTQKTFLIIISLVTFACIGTFALISIFGNTFLPLVWGEKVKTILPFVTLYTFAMVFFTVGNTIVNYHQIKKQYLFPSLGIFLAIQQIMGIVFFHTSIQAIATVMILIGFEYLVCMIILHFFYEQINIVLRNAIDLLGIFSPVSYEPRKHKKGLNMLILNWRDKKHVLSGGAEIYLHEIARYWVKNGNHVTLFCGNDGFSKRFEIVDGVRIIRRGGFYTVYVWAFLYYIRHFRGKFDVIIDSENGTPFFAPLFSKKPIILLIHHIHQEVFRDHLRFPFSLIAKVLEGTVMPFVYRNKKIITVSRSSQKEIENIGMGKNDEITIIPPGIYSGNFKKQEKTPFPSFVYLGRLKAYKNIDVAIKAFYKVIQIYTNAQLFIVGSGTMQSQLETLVQNLHLEKHVSFLHKVSDKKKIHILGKSWVALQPSQVEGWGITVIEANACGTPVIASNVNGLKDSVIDGKTGMLVPVGNVDKFAEAMLSLIELPKKRFAFSQEAYTWALTFDWQYHAKKFSLVITSYIEDNKARRVIDSSFIFSQKQSKI